MSETEQEQPQPQPGPPNQDDLDADFAEAADIILGRSDPQPEQPAQPEPDAEPADDGVDAPQGGVYDDNGRLRDAQTGSFTTAEALLEKYGMASLDEFAMRYDENNRKVGSMANEVGDARRELDEWRKFGQQYQQQLQQPRPQMMSEEELNSWDEWTVEHPLEAAQRAMQSGDPMLYERTIDTWYAEDPKAASRFETTIALQRQQQMLEQQMRPMLGPLQDQYQQQALGQAVGQIKGMYPDFDQVVGNQGLLQNAVDYLGGDAFVKALNESPSAAEKAEGLNILYLVARGISNTLGQQQPGPPPQNIAGRIQGQLASPSQIPQGGNANTVQGALTDLWEQGLASYEG